MPDLVSQKELELVADPNDTANDGGSADNSADDSGGNDTSKAPDKGDKSGDSKGSGDVFDDVDDDSKGKDAGKQKGKQETTKKPDESKGSDKEPTGDNKPDNKQEGDDTESPEQKTERERLAADTQWRDRLAARILAPTKDKISAAKYEKRLDQVLTQLKRYKSMDEAVIGGFAAQERIRSGEHRKAPEGASAEEDAAWRKENNLPTAPEDYVMPKIDGHEWGDADDPQVNSFREVAFNNRLDKDTADNLVRWKVEQDRKIVEEYEANLKVQDRRDRESAHDAIRTEFGVAEFKPHMEIAKRLIEDDEVFGDEIKPLIAQARYHNPETNTWHRLSSHPVFLRGLIALAVDRYGEGAMTQTDARAHSSNRRAEIEKVRDSDYERYMREGMADELLAMDRKEQERAEKRAKR